MKPQQMQVIVKDYQATQSQVEVEIEEMGQSIDAQPEEECSRPIPMIEQVPELVASFQKQIEKGHAVQSNERLVRAAIILLAALPFLLFLGLLVSGLLNGFAYFSISLLTLLWSVGSLNKAFPFFLGCLASETPLAIIVPNVIIFILCCTGTLDYFSPNKSLSALFGLVGMVLGIISCLMQVLNLWSIIIGFQRSATALQDAGIDQDKMFWVNWLHAFFPLNLTGMVASGIHVDKNVCYATVKSTIESTVPMLRRHLDGKTGMLHLVGNVYHKSLKHGAEKRPALLMIHGGAWIHGAKDGATLLPLIYKAASQGWVVVSIDYQLAPYAKFPEQLIDCKRALAWMRSPEAAQRFGIDPATIVVSGDSAGGHLSMLLALTQSRLDLQPGFQDADCSVQGCAEFFGPQDMHDTHGHFQALGIDLPALVEVFLIQQQRHEVPGVYDLISPYEQLKTLKTTKCRPCPWIGMQGSRDGLAPVQASREFYKRLFNHIECGDSWQNSKDGTCGAKGVVRIEHKAAFHGFNSFPTLRGQGVNHTISAFLKYCRNESKERLNHQASESPSAKQENTVLPPTRTEMIGSLVQT